MRSIALGRWPRAIERIELFPAPRGKYSGLLTSQTLNNCIIFYAVTIRQFFCILSPLSDGSCSRASNFEFELKFPIHFRFK